jgi:hypothetical protein
VDNLKWLREEIERSRSVPQGHLSHGRVHLDAARLSEAADEIESLREALDCLLPGLVLDLRYADPDDDKDAMRSRIETITRVRGGV